jgi:biotin carboxyl carrier protein
VRRHEFEHEGREHSVRLSEAGGHELRAVITSKGLPDRELRFLPTDLGGGRYLVRVGDEVREVRVERDATGQVLRVRMPQGTVALEKLDPFRDSVRQGKAGGGSRKINAPIPGRVVDVLVAAGDTVAAGQPVVIVEAMKMANELRSPVAGRVASVAAVVGAPVDAGTTLVVIES